MLLILGKAAHLSSHVLHKVGVLGEGVPATVVAVAVAVTQLAHILVHLEALVEAHGHGVVLSHGCCRSMAAWGRETSKKYS